jgi:predicted RNA-binding protein YlqC (UPF0109 family)
MNDLKYLKSIIEPLVDNLVKYERSVGEKGVSIIIDGDRDDKRILIGVGGQNIDAIRRIMTIYGRRNREIFDIIVKT